MTGRTWRSIAAVAGTVGAGALAGQLVAADPEPEASRAVRVGAATLHVPHGWRVEAAQHGTATLAPDDPALARVIVAFGPPDDPSLVPPALRRRFAGVDPASRPTRLGGYRAWAYRVPDRAAEVTVLPSSRGVVGIACEPRTPGAQERCARAVGSVSVAGAAMLAPAPDLALRLRAPEVLATLDAARLRTRAELHNAGPQTRARLAREAAGEYTAARDALRPVAGSTGRSLIGALSDAGRAYAAFAGSGAARADVDAADAAVAAAVSALAASGAPPVQRRAIPAPPAQAGVSVLTLTLILALGLLGSALAPRAVSRARGHRKPAAAPSLEPEAEPCLLAPLRRRLTTPPPTGGRWYEKPTGYGGREESVATDAVAVPGRGEVS